MSAAQIKVKLPNLNNKIDIVGIKFPILSYEKCLVLFKYWIKEGQSHQVCIANVHTVMTALKDPELRFINHLSLVTLDGTPLVWYAKLVRKSKEFQRVCGPELMLRCLEHGQQHQWKHFFLGGKEDVLHDLVNVVKYRYPKANIVGSYSPPFRTLTEEEDQALVDLINQQKPDFLWVGLGAPKQEKWIAAHIDRLQVPVQLGVGAAFDFNSGHVLRAPLWMQDNGLEWIYRVFQDKRLFKRYLATNPLFLMYFVRDLLHSKLSKKNLTPIKQVSY